MITFICSVSTLSPIGSLLVCTESFLSHPYSEFDPIFFTLRNTSNSVFLDAFDALLRLHLLGIITVESMLWQNDEKSATMGPWQAIARCVIFIL